MSAEAASEGRAQPQEAVEVSALRRFYWSVLREVWEHRSLYLAPLGVAALVVVGFVISLVHLPATLRAAAALDEAHRQAALERPYAYAGLILMFTTTLVAVFYCIDALYGERRDRAILFWKSLPVSDTMTVLAKASIPVVFLPLLTFAITVVTQGVMVALASVRLIGTGLGAGLNLRFGQMLMPLLAHLVLVHGLWYAPFWGWFLLVSAWSRRAPFLWAILPPLALGLVEKIAFDTSHFVSLLGNRFAGSGGTLAGGAPMSLSSLAPGDLASFVSNPGLWIGLALTAAFLLMAARLRRHRSPM
jgi:ABC-2 type transport system permease protein